jgi:N-methylhydantoinase A
VRRVGVDIGGTFTDLVWLDEASLEVGRAKALSTPEPLEGLRAAIAAGGAGDAGVRLFLHATTLVTNLVLERRGATVGLVTTAGFLDVIEFQTGMRPNPYDLQWERNEPLVPRHLRREIGERIGANGGVLLAPDPAEIEAAVGELVAAGVDALAICLVNAYANPTHELLVEEVVRGGWPGLRISRSSAVDPRIREYPRLSTTVVNAYALPAFQAYAEDLAASTPFDAEVRFMQSSGGVCGLAAASRTPVNLVYSGPAGGVLGAQRMGRQQGLPDMITLDMGGTSTDVCVIAGGAAGEREELELEWGVPVRTRTMDISAVGAGGGSIAHVDAGGALQVGPRSARSRPGPACYGLGGTEPTVTDANLVLGLIRPGSLRPGGVDLDRAAAEAAIAPVAGRFGLELEAAAHGIYRTVNATMAQVIREITVFRGIDPRAHVLVAFGGCGPQHAAEVAREVGIREVVIPRLPSVFSALGLLTASLGETAMRTRIVPLDRLDPVAARAVLAELAREASASLEDDPVVDRITLRRTAYLRYVGQSHELPVDVDAVDADALREAFEAAHERQYGTRLGDPVELVDLRVTATGHVPDVAALPWAGGELEPAPVALASSAGRTLPVFDRETLAAGARLAGPALVEEGDSTTYIPEDGEARIDEHGNIRIALG